MGHPYFRGVHDPTFLSRASAAGAGPGPMDASGPAAGPSGLASTGAAAMAAAAAAAAGMMGGMAGMAGGIGGYGEAEGLGVGLGPASIAAAAAGGSRGQLLGGQPQQVVGMGGRWATPVAPPTQAAVLAAQAQAVAFA